MPFIIRWMGMDYIDSYQVLAVLVIGIIFNTLQITPRSLLYGLSKHKAYAILLMAETVVKLILSLILIRRYGIVGVAIGTIIPMVLTSAIIIPAYASHVIDLKISRYAKSIGSVMILGAVLHVASWLLIRDHLRSNYLSIAILGVISSLVFLTAIGFIVLGREERRYFKIPI